MRDRTVSRASACLRQFANSVWSNLKQATSSWAHNAAMPSTSLESQRIWRGASLALDGSRMCDGSRPSTTTCELRWGGRCTLARPKSGYASWALYGVAGHGDMSLKGGAGLSQSLLCQV